jgi:hypothetical protein
LDHVAAFLRPVEEENTEDFGTLEIEIITSRSGRNVPNL